MLASLYQFYNDIFILQLKDLFLNGVLTSHIGEQGIPVISPMLQQQMQATAHCTGDMGAGHELYYTVPN